MRVFLDVGAHEGQTIEAVIGRFDRIYAFEPMPKQYEHLERRFGDKRWITLANYGLADFTGYRNLYGVNNGMEASWFADKNDVDPRFVTRCEFISASEFFIEKLTDDMQVTMKLNCEGCEVAVMNDLLDSGEVWKLKEVMIDFDVRKIPSQQATERRLIDRMLKANFTRYVLSEDVMIGATHQDRIRHWLDA